MYGLYWRVNEIIAAQMEGTDPPCSVTYSVSRWSHLLVTRPSGVWSRVQKLASTYLLTAGREGNDITLTNRNLLKYRDEYSKKSGVTLDNVPPRTDQIRRRSEGEQIRSEEGAELSVASPLPNQGIPGERPGAKTPPMERAANHQQKVAKAAIPPPELVGPEHPVAQKFLEYVGRKTKWLKQAEEWDRNARQLEVHHSRTDLLGAIEYIWGPSADGFWMKRLNANYSNPFASFSDSIESIMEQYHDLLSKQKYSSNKEIKSDRDLSNFNPFSE